MPDRPNGRVHGIAARPPRLTVWALALIATALSALLLAGLALFG